jgi:hypothetical protein
LVTSSESADGGGQSAPFSNSYAKTFYDQFPYYLSIGMTPEQYWDGDPALAKYYRKADEIKRKRLNEELWLQGLYIYEALCDVSPVLNAFAKKGTKPRPYADHPYALSNHDREEERKMREKQEREKARRYMEAKMAAINKRFTSN